MLSRFVQQSSRVQGVRALSSSSGDLKLSSTGSSKVRARDYPTERRITSVHVVGEIFQDLSLGSGIER